jgi:hypothetical protein
MKAAVNIANKGKGGRLVFGELDFNWHFGRQGSEKGVQTPNSPQQNGYDWGGERCGFRVSPLFSPAAIAGARKLSGIGMPSCTT